MRYLISYAQRAEARFLSHLEVLRAFERALRRAGLPLKLSQGFNPRPYLAFALPLAVGTAGRAEYLEVELREAVAGTELAQRLGSELPPGLRLKSVRPLAPELPPLPALVAGAAYLVRPSWRPEPAPGAVEAAVAALMGRREITAGEPGKERDIRPGIWCLRPKRRRGKLYLTLLVAAGGRGHVRPDWVVRALAEAGGWESDRPADCLRLAVLGEVGGRLVPLGLVGGAG